MDWFAQMYSSSKQHRIISLATHRIGQSYIANSISAVSNPKVWSFACKHLSLKLWVLGLLLANQLLMKPRFGGGKEFAMAQLRMCTLMQVYVI